MAAKAEPQFLYLSTSGWKTGKKHKIEIWFVEHDGRYYIISEHENNAHWVQNILHNPKVFFSIDKAFFQAHISATILFTFLSQGKSYVAPFPPGNTTAEYSFGSTLEIGTVWFILVTSAGICRNL